MAQSLRQVKSRIKSIDGVRKITRAMEMVSSAKLKPLQRALLFSREYSSRIERITGNLLCSFGGLSDELLLPRREIKNILLCVITSDTGLCAGYNAGVIRSAEDFIRKNDKPGISLLVVGRKGLNHFTKRGFFIAGSRAELYGHYSNELADGIAAELAGAFISKKADEVHIAYADYLSASKIVFAVKKILNVEVEPGENIEYLVEPDAPSLIKELLPLYLKARFRHVLLSAFTAESSIRIMAMHEATTNAGEMLDSMVVQRNKMRQAQITGDLIEVISSAAALKG